MDQLRIQPQRQDCNAPRQSTSNGASANIERATRTQVSNERTGIRTSQRSTYPSVLGKAVLLTKLEH
jgi:hypothetical protein